MSSVSSPTYIRVSAMRQQTRAEQSSCYKIAAYFQRALVGFCAAGCMLMGARVAKNIELGNEAFEGMLLPFSQAIGAGLVCGFFSNFFSTKEAAFCAFMASGLYSLQTIHHPI